MSNDRILKQAAMTLTDLADQLHLALRGNDVLTNEQRDRASAVYQNLPRELKSELEELGRLMGTRISGSYSDPTDRSGWLTVGINRMTPYMQMRPIKGTLEVIFNDGQNSTRKKYEYTGRLDENRYDVADQIVDEWERMLMLYGSADELH